ncbi:conserved exported hypothetical protein [Candidatus Sulfotelmatomonas gaucii]|uniref:Uncharacterized protein n=1 Tax=Candidatus Sulfuritelmatomonas gaucii TaxID=2043161 RepID=A0A2N9L378_9BACT|nr:conserved exported hypothetical protein [Candidatus Sulfotelmatomonas gaucii]
MTLHRFAVMTLVLFLGPSISDHARAYGQPQGPPQTGYYGQQSGNWDAPPREFNDIQRQGFRDGIEGARKDIQNHRRPDPNNRDEYRHPNVPPPVRDAYREGFRRGYDRGIQNLMGGPPMQPAPAPTPVQPAPPPERGAWGVAGGPDNEVMLHGFQDGMVGALRDLQNHRTPDPNNRDEYRRPNVPYEMQGAYRDGFRDGYARGNAMLTGGFGRGDDFMRGAFEDGVAGALNDFSNNRRPDPNNRDEFRHPHVSYDRVDAYRDAFSRGYNRAMSELTGYSGRR